MLQNLGELLPVSSARFGQKVALVFEGQCFSYIHLDELSGRLAAALGKLGVEPGDRVTLYAANSWEWVVSYYGVLKAGAVINPVNMMLTPSELAFVVRDCSARVLIASADKAGSLGNILVEASLEHLIVFGGAPQSGALAFSDLLEAHEPLRPREEAELGSLATIAYTSGTTGHPKGAMQSHRNVLINAEETASLHGKSYKDVVVTALPCPHVYGTVVMNGIFMRGGTLVLHSAFDVDKILDSIEEHGATMFEGVPTMYYYLLKDPTIGQRNLDSLTRCTVGGQTIPVAKMKEIEQRLGCPLIELWGMTELAGLGATHAFSSPTRQGSIGKPLPSTHLRIAAIDDATATLPAGDVGELMAKGPHVMLGYYGNPDATRETIESDGWLHTGDLARMDEDGYFYVIDRKKDMILTAGYNIYPAEIERVIAGHPAVAMVAVGSIEDEIKGELARAYIVLKEGLEVTANEVVAYCRQELAAYKVPRSITFVTDLPKTSSGKIMRRKLQGLDTS